MNVNYAKFQKRFDRTELKNDCACHYFARENRENINKMDSTEEIYLKQELGRPDKLQTFAKDGPVRGLRHISWTPQFHTWTPTEILLRSQETRGSFIRNVLFKSIFSRQMSRRLGNLERDWQTGSPVTHAQSFFSSVGLIVEQFQGNDLQYHKHRKTTTPSSSNLAWGLEAFSGPNHCTSVREKKKRCRFELPL